MGLKAQFYRRVGGPESAFLQKIVVPSNVLLLPFASKLECVLCKKGFSGQNVIKAGRCVRSTQRHPDKTTNVSDLHRGTLTKPQMCQIHTEAPKQNHRCVRSTQRHPDKTTDVSDLHRGTLTKPQMCQIYTEAP